MHPNTVTLTQYGSHTQTGAVARTIKLPALRATVALAQLRFVLKAYGFFDGYQASARVRLVAASHRLDFLADLIAEQKSVRATLRTGCDVYSESECRDRLEVLTTAIEHESLAILGLAANADLEHRDEVLAFAAREGVKFQ